ncbi:carbonic anhydrase [Klebsiella michiganensis]|nr:carbonic anhydrase [Klebsiella michiganensis]
MATSLRRYKDLFPKTGLRVMIDSSSVVIGDVRIADECQYLASGRHSR